VGKARYVASSQALRRPAHVAVFRSTNAAVA
jgi:hypothetical protein